jgi:hypothetical protein
MVVKLKFSALGQDHWYDYAIRLVLGGLTTVVAGLIADAYGPAIGGLMLGFPAIFCASATLTARNERKKKAKKGLQGAKRGRQAAALDSAGVRLGQRRHAGFWRMCLATRGSGTLDQPRYGVSCLGSSSRRAVDDAS